MAFWVYVLRCANGQYYTGHTDDLDRRLAQHQTGGFCDFTSRRRPVELAWADWLPTRLEALEAERRVKDWSRAKKEGLFRSDWRAVSYFARPPHERGPWPAATEPAENPFASSEVEKAGDEDTREPFASSKVEKRSPGTIHTPFASSEVEKRVSTSLDTNGAGDLAKMERAQ